MAFARKFMKEHYKHFNAATVVDASQAYCDLVDSGGKMFLTMAGAMSTAELGKSLAEMIRKGKVHAITCTGANLEEDVFNLVANKSYKRVPDYRQFTPQMETELYNQGFNRVTDTCIPEEEAMRKIESAVLKLWQKHEKEKKAAFPHEYMYELLKSGVFKEHYDIDPKDSWLLAAAEKNLPMFVPGWEDSTLGNMFVSQTMKGGLKSMDYVKGGVYYMRDPCIGTRPFTKQVETSSPPALLLHKCVEEREKKRARWKVCRGRILTPAGMKPWRPNCLRGGNWLSAQRLVGGPGSGSAPAIAPLLAALKKEKNEATRSAMMSSLARGSAFRRNRFLTAPACWRNPRAAWRRASRNLCPGFRFSVCRRLVHWADNGRWSSWRLCAGGWRSAAGAKAPEPGPLLRHYAAHLKTPGARGAGSVCAGNLDSPGH